MKLPQLKIRLYGDPCLRKKSKAVEHVGPGERLLIQAMLDCMYESKGIGLAAPQVGINRQIFVADTGEGPIVVVNPRVIKKQGVAVLEEGCLSIPDVHLNVKRPDVIAVEYIDENNDLVRRELTEMWSRVFQHESDHLHGKLIIDYAGIKDRARIQSQLKFLMDDYKRQH